MTYRELEAQVIALPPADKARLFQLLAPEMTHVWPGIEKTPGVCGGDARIAHTRISVWVLEGWRRSGLTDAQILQSYPTLTATDVANAWTYVTAHQDEIDEAIRRNEAA
jgi:uncharacterized protein (DUF433 family)